MTLYNIYTGKKGNNGMDKKELVQNAETPMLKQYSTRISLGTDKKNTTRKGMGILYAGEIHREIIMKCNWTILQKCFIGQNQWNFIRKKKRFKLFNNIILHLYG